MVENQVVPEALDDSNYEIWSNCMEIYLLSRGLWDTIEPGGEANESSSEKWKRRNALALHAIHMSCGSRATLSKICKLKSAKEAWDLLRSMNQQSPHHSEKKKLDDSRLEIVAKKVPSSQVDDDIETKLKSRQEDAKMKKIMEDIESRQSIQKPPNKHHDRVTPPTSPKAEGPQAVDFSLYTSPQMNYRI